MPNFETKHFNLQNSYNRTWSLGELRLYTLIKKGNFHSYIIHRFDQLLRLKKIVFRGGKKISAYTPPPSSLGVIMYLSLNLLRMIYESGVLLLPRRMWWWQLPESLARTSPQRRRPSGRRSSKKTRGRKAGGRQTSDRDLTKKN